MNKNNYSDLIKKFFLTIEKIFDDVKDEEIKNKIKSDLFDALFLNFIWLTSEEEEIKNIISQNKNKTFSDEELKNKEEELKLLFEKNEKTFFPLFKKAIKITLDDLIEEEKFELNDVKRQQLFQFINQNFNF
jgi:hypothetical protein